MNERCKHCIHFYEEQIEYDYCHECAMNADYFKPISDASSKPKPLTEATSTDWSEVYFTYREKT